MSPRYVFGACAIALFVAAILLGGSFSAFINAPSLLIVFGGAFSVTLAFHSPSELYRALRAGCCSQDAEPGKSAHTVTVLSTLRTATVGCGVAGTLIGLVQMLQNLEDPSAIGPAMAVALLTAFYAILASELVLGPMINRTLILSEQPVASAQSGAGGEA